MGGGDEAVVFAGTDLLLVGGRFVLEVFDAGEHRLMLGTVRGSVDEKGEEGDVQNRDRILGVEAGDLCGDREGFAVCLGHEPTSEPPAFAGEDRCRCGREFERRRRLGDERPDGPDEFAGERLDRPGAPEVGRIDPEPDGSLSHFGNGNLGLEARVGRTADRLQPTGVGLGEAARAEGVEELPGRAAVGRFAGEGEADAPGVGGGGREFRLRTDQPRVGVGDREDETFGGNGGVGDRVAGVPARFG